MPAGTPFVPISYLAANAAATPDRVAILQRERTLTFGELERSVHAAANALGQKGIGPGDVVGVSLPNVWQYVVLELAIPLLGAIIIPLPLSLGAADRQAAISRSGARCVIEEAEARGVCDAGFAGRVVPPPADPDRIVEIALTSGSTGMPKLASLHAGLKQATYEAFTSRLQITNEDRVLPLSPLTQGIGGMTLYCLRTGASLLMLGSARFDAAGALTVAAELGSTCLVGVPTNVIRMLESPALGKVDLRRLRCTAIAGAPMPVDAARRWEERTGSRVVLFYGSMDTGQLSVGSPTDPVQKRWTTVGRVHDCAEARITEDGEICMRGPTVQRRYWGEERGPLAADGWAHLGDLGFIDAEGYLHVTGRLKDIIIRGGANINPYEVEEVMRSHPDVVDVCVVPRPDPDLGERAHAVVAARRRFDLEDLRIHLSAAGLSRYKWPESLELVDELPLAGPGKVDRKALRERVQPPSR